MKYIDTHAHMNFTLYDHDRDKVISRTKGDDVMVINVGTGQADSKTAVNLAESHDHLYAIIGLHPIHSLGHTHAGKKTEGEIFDVEYYRQLALSSGRVVGIGECGLDYCHNSIDTKPVQEKVFRGQIELALELDLPLMLHVRPSEGSMDAYHDVLHILREYSDNPRLRGQTHFFAGTKEIIDEFIGLGFYISFTGVITFAGMYEKLVKHTPIDKILSETDAPYVTPIPYRGQRNEPSNVREVLGKISRTQKIGEEEMAAQVMKNAQTLYRLA